jgi:hypothetical protein
MEVEGRWSFHPVSELPSPKPFVSGTRIYASGASTGSSLASGT